MKPQFLEVSNAIVVLTKDFALVDWRGIIYSRFL